jgi:hypothetical protein
MLKGLEIVVPRKRCRIGQLMEESFRNTLHRRDHVFDLVLQNLLLNVRSNVVVVLLREGALDGVHRLQCLQSCIDRMVEVLQGRVMAARWAEKAGAPSVE